ncbi:unnamed protein product [Orchesella dallaii]|uniref:Thioredoxin domain-containing protein n=1 Tax=Orchesella dallaii TaxID=48710 RepID=A0ABP1PNJ6_9HEXA
MDSKIILVLLGVVGVMAYAAPFSATSEIKSVFELRRSLQDVIGSAVVVRFYSHRCGACEADAPHFYNLLEKYFEGSVEFYTVDIDEYPELAHTDEYVIDAVPTYIVKKRNSQYSAFHRAQDDSRIVLFLICATAVVVTTAPTSINRISTVRTEDELIQGLERVLSSNRTAVIRFYAEWCPVCQADVHEFNKLLDKYPDSSTRFFRIDVDQHPQLTADYGIRAVPTYFVLRRNTRHVTFHGAQDVDNFLQRGST